MGGQNSKRKISLSLRNPVATAGVTYDVIHQKQRIAQNFLLIWIDANIDESKQDCQHTLAQLRSVVNDVKIFTRPEQCIEFLDGVQNETAFVIVSGSLGQHLVPDIHAFSHVDAIYIFCGNKSRHEQWTKEWVKIKGIHTEIKSICDALQSATKQCNQDSIVVSFVSACQGTSSQNLNQLEPSFMYTQIFKEILIEMEHSEKSIKDLADYCRQFYSDNKEELNIIKEFGHNYRTKSPIWWYTRECFTYQMLNRALRTLEGDTIISMGFFIRDLHKQIEQLYQAQVGTYHGKTFIVYRGQGLLKTDFEKLMISKNGLMSFNNFLSTSKKGDVSLGFAKHALTRTDTIGILFRMSIDPSVSSTPFASIQKISFFQTEEEILFSMHTVFRIGEITRIDNNSLLYQVDLKLTADDDQQLRALTKRIREEVEGETGWSRLGQLLIKLNQIDKAEELYRILLEQTSDEGEKAIYYNNLAYIKDVKGDYKKAIEYYEKALEIYRKTLTPDHSSLATVFNNIGGVYKNMEEHSKALSYREKALEIRRKTLPPDHPDLAITYNNIGLVYDNMGEYLKALSFYEKTLNISQKTLPSTHPSLATSYNNIAGVYFKMTDYSNALLYYQRALNILRNSLPSNHPSIKTVQENIECVKMQL